MYFESFSALMQMGGHGAYVWSAYAIAFVVMISLVVIPVRRSREFMRQQRMQLRREEESAQ